MSLFLKLIILGFIYLAAAQNVVDKVKCDHTTPTCECKSNRDGDNAPITVCEFQMDIEMLQTFTRYEVNADGDSHGTAGSVWYIDSNGVWQSAAQDSNDPCLNIPIGDPRCTDPFGVDGYTFRSFLAVNGRIPGPTIIVTQDQLVKVNVINRLASESISLHWHGMHQRNSNWMDGVEHVTQCGIPPGTSFTYIFKATQHGTHWYHSHSGAQRTDGLFGALIVRDKNRNAIFNILLSLRAIGSIPNYRDLPEQHTLSFLDWQKSASLDLFTQIHSSIRFFDIEEAKELTNRAERVRDRTYSSDGAEVGPVPYWSGLINGRGSYLANRSNSILSNFTVEPSKIYRFRLIGAQSLYAYRVSIAEHKLIVIATDGAYVNPMEVDYIIIHSGERYDFLLKTKDETELSSKSNFGIYGITLEETYKKSGVLGGNHTAEAILHYNVPVASNPWPISDYQSVLSDKIFGIDPDERTCTTDNKCMALNCPFENFPSNYNTECIHVHNLTLHYSEVLLPVFTQLPNAMFADSVFFNFGFEGVRQTSAINGRNLKLPSGALAVLNENELNEIKNKEYCQGLTDSTMCDYDNTADDNVIAPQCVCTHVKNITKYHSIQLVISAVGPNPNETENFLFAHPVHLHGHYFHVVDIRFGKYNTSQHLMTGNDDIDCGGNNLCTNPTWKQGYTGSNQGKTMSKAPLKDTILIPAGGYAVVYFKADNPGWWFLHCHIEVHQLEGMGVIINEGTYSHKTPAPYTMNKCGNFSFTVEEFNKAIENNLDPSSTTTTSPPSSSVNFYAATIGLGTVATIFLIIIIILIVSITIMGIVMYLKD